MMGVKGGLAAASDNGSKKTSDKTKPKEDAAPPPPKPPGVEYATVNGMQVKPQNYPELYHGASNKSLGFPESMSPEQAAQRIYSEGLPARGSNIDLIDHAIHAEEQRAFRGTTVNQLTPNNDAGAAKWAGDGGLVIRLKDVPGYDVNQLLEGRVPGPLGFGNNPNHGELEIAVPGAISPKNIVEIGVVKTNPRTGKPEIVWIPPKGK